MSFTEMIAPQLRSEPLRIAIVEWSPGDELVGLIADAAVHLGHEVSLLAPTGRLPPGIDVLLVFGPFGSISSLMVQLVDLPRGRRPLLAWWLTEQLWHPALPDWFARPAAELRSGLERAAMRTAMNGHAARGHWLTWRALRFRFYGDMLWLRRHGLLSVLAIPSRWLGQFLQRRGFDVTHAYVGADPSFAAEPAATRDIPVLWLGTHGSARRRRNLERVSGALARHGVEVMAVDGIRHPPIYGAARAELLSRSRIVLNLVRKPWDSNFLRFLLAAPNGAMMISEPLLPHYPVQNGVHLIETPLDHMADVVCRYLDDEPARSRIAAQAHQLVTTDLTLTRGLDAVLRRAAQVRAAAGA